MGLVHDGQKAVALLQVSEPFDIQQVTVHAEEGFRDDARLFPAGIKFSEASIGRVITRETVRGTGLGHVLIREAIASVAALWGVQPIRIGAQSRLTAYYRQHGFVEVGPAYLEDNIDHQDMLFTPS